MADIVLPATTTLERNDIGFSGREGHLVAMKKAMEAPGEALDDFAILARLAGALGVEAEFTEGRDEHGWLAALYAHWAKALAREGTAMPDFEAFWAGDGLLRIRPELRPSVFLGNFREDPEAHRLTTPSGRIEIASERVMGFGYDDCPGYPAWREPPEWLKGQAAARHPLHLISNQPARKLHSQLDHAPFSRAGKVHGREPLSMHPDDAARRGLAAGAIVRVFNERGACLAGLVLSDAVMPGVVVMATGSWFDPADWEGGRPLEKHGNPNVLTSDVGTSRLAQGTTAMTCLVEVEAFSGVPPTVTAYELPPGIAPPP
jgi:biotin/methionine sulfoxide reductase